jgi:polyphosphate glucokinase
MVQVLGIDIGGSEVKGAIVDTSDGSLRGPTTRIATPRPADPSAIVEVIRNITMGLGWSGPLGVAFPSPIVDGIVTTADNIDASWVGRHAADLLATALDRPVTALNDGDAAAVAEVRFGAAPPHGTVLVLTFGTGVGSGLLHDGRLIPNTELGLLQFAGTDLETYAAARAITREGLDDPTWSARANAAMTHLCQIIAPTRIVVGGGISERFEQLRLGEGVPVPVVPARFGNDAGIVGAALAAARSESSIAPTSNGLSAAHHEDGLLAGELLSTTSRGAAADGRTTEGERT